MATIAYRPTDMLAKVSIDRYLGYQHDLIMTPNRLSFEQYLCVATYQYLLVKAIGVRRYRSIPIAQSNRFARVPMGAYCPVQRARKGIDRYLLPVS